MISSPRLLIVEDEPFIAADIQEICVEYNYIVAAIAYTFEEAVHAINTLNIDYILLDIQLGSVDDGLKLGQLISTEYFIPFSYITSFSDQKTIEAAKATNPMGYLIKPFRPQDVFIQIQLGIHLKERIGSSKTPSKTRINQHLKTEISAREYEVLIEIGAGKSNQEISDCLFISMNTVKSHIKSIFIKFNAKSRTDLLNQIHTLEF